MTKTPTPIPAISGAPLTASQIIDNGGGGGHPDIPPAATDNAGDGAAEKAKIAAELAEREAEEAKAKAASDEAAQAILQRRKMGRGSTRRIVRARDALDMALIAFRKEIDFEIFEVDDQGVKIGPWPIMRDVDNFRAFIADKIGEILK